MSEKDLGIRHPVTPERPDLDESYLRELRAARSNFRYLQGPIDPTFPKPEEIVEEKVTDIGTLRILNRKDNSGYLIKTYTPHNQAAPKE